jgi:hypothetical protein
MEVTKEAVDLAYSWSSLGSPLFGVAQEYLGLHGRALALQRRVAELEAAIRVHMSVVGDSYVVTPDDQELWSHLEEDA